MSEIAADALGLSIDGPVAGLGVHFDKPNPDDVKLDSSTPSVDLKVNEGSLKRAENITGVSHTPVHGSKAEVPLSLALTQQKKGDDKFVSMISGNKLQSAVERGMSSRERFGSRPNYRAHMSQSEMPKGPLARIQQRRKLELRRTFNSIAARKKKTVALNADSLPSSMLKKMVEKAINTGLAVTPIGALPQAIKKAGIAPKAAPQKKRQWALFYNPEMIPSGWAMD